MGQTICDNDWCTTTIFFILNQINTFVTFGAGTTCDIIERFKTERTYELNSVIANIDYSCGNKVIVFHDKDDRLREDPSKVLNQILYNDIKQAMYYNVIRNFYAAKFCFDDGEIELQIKY